MTKNQCVVQRNTREKKNYQSFAKLSTLVKGLTSKFIAVYRYHYDEGILKFLKAKSSRKDSNNEQATRLRYRLIKKI